jgi:uncharacterized protein YbjT (DUF2867 family)
LRASERTRVMGEARLHVVFGAGQAGRALVAHLAGPGVALRAVSRHWPVTLAGGIDWRAADAADPEVAADAARGAWVVYQCVNAGKRSGRSGSRGCTRACWLLPGAPVRCRWW